MAVTQDTGGPAFPSPTGNVMQDGGITVLDWFAGQALSGLLASDEFSQSSPEALARLSYGQARAMMNERT